MNNLPPEDEFQFVYSSPNREEIMHIRKKYLPEQESKMEKLRRLDRAVTEKAQVVSLVLGIIGALFFGTGMSLLMSPLADYLGISPVFSTILGIFFGIFGGILAALAYPTHQYVMKRERQKVSDEIIKLTDELMS